MLEYLSMGNKKYLNINSRIQEYKKEKIYHRARKMYNYFNLLVPDFPILTFLKRKIQENKRKIFYLFCNSVIIL